MSQARITRNDGTARKYEYYKASGYCKDYDPCPINMKCRARAAHLRQKCASCPVPLATHTDKARNFMIRRENFAIKVTDETGEKLKEWKQQLSGE